MPDGKQSGVLEKKGPLFRKEQGKPVEVDLLVVYLHLCEIGVVGQVERHARCHAVLQVGTQVACVEVASVFSPTQRFTQHVRRELQVPLWRNLDSLELSGERDPIDVVLTRERRPVRLLVPNSNVSLEVHAPALHRVPRIAERAEWNGDLGGPPDVGHTRGYLPRAIPVEVEAAARTTLLPTVAGTSAAATAEPAAALPLIRHLAVVLDAGWVGPEDEAVLPVEVGVEENLETVGLRHVGITTAVGNDDRGRVLGIAHHPEIDRVGGIDNAYLGAL